MAHVRKQIRDNIFTAVNNLSTTGTNAFKTRLFPISEAKLPAICLYAKEESSNIVTLSPPRLIEFECTFTIEIYVKASSSLDDTVDQISLEVTEALTSDVTRSSLARDTQVISFELDFDGEGDQQVAVASIDFLVLYSCLENDLETAK